MNTSDARLYQIKVLREIYHDQYRQDCVFEMAYSAADAITQVELRFKSDKGKVLTVEPYTDTHGATGA